MFISDFAIRRPVITVVTHAGARGVRRLRADRAADRRVPRGRRRRIVVGGDAVSRARRPTTSSARSSSPIEERSPASAASRRSESNSLDSFGVIIVEFDFAKNLQEATQDIRDEHLADPQRSAARDEGAGPHALQPDRLPDRPARADVEDADRRRADASRRSRHHAPAARRRRRRPKSGGRAASSAR